MYCKNFVWIKNCLIYFNLDDVSNCIDNALNTFVNMK